MAFGVRGGHAAVKQQWLWKGLVALCVACGGDAGPTEPEIDPLLVPLVGDWSAASVVVTSAGDSTISVDVIAEGGTMALNVQPSGAYTLSLSYGGYPIVDVGQLTVREDYIISQPSNGSPPETLSYEFPSADRLRLSGAIVFPFTSATPTAGSLVAELTRD